MTQQNLKSYRVWDRPVRIFHWVAVLTFIPMVALGLVMMFSRDLGISAESKVLLKAVHIWIGYVFFLNIVVRIIWGFYGNRFARWKAVLPFGKVYKAQYAAYLEARKTKRKLNFLGHNPLGRWSVMVMLFLMTAQSVTGLVLASTDLYMPPFGSHIKAWVAQDEASMALIVPGDRETGINPQAYQDMRDFRTPYRSWHTYFFYLLIISVVVHIAAVVRAEKKEGSGLTSGMITGNKVYPEKPFDAD